MPDTPDVIDLGAMPYARAYARQTACLDAVLAAREQGRPILGTILLVEHAPPVITISRRPDARKHLVASQQVLASLGVTVEETDRGGDITYHGPGQLVVYPILDLNALRLGLHDYMRLLEQAVIDTCRLLGVPAVRDACATGVWVPRDAATTAGPVEGDASCPLSPAAKICAMGVRVRKWVTMHGLALNVSTNLDHFGLIVPCGLAGRPVTSLQAELGPACPSMAKVKATLTASLIRHVCAAADHAASARAES